MKWLLAFSAPVFLCATLPATAQQSYPGSTPLPADAAMDFFVEVCGKNVPDIDKAHDVLKKADFWQRPETGTYYHPKYNLSFKIIPRDGGICSMVFVSDEKPESVALGLGMAAAASVKSEDDSPVVGFDPKSNVSRVEFQEGWVFELDPTGNDKGQSRYHAYISIRPEG
jgi:hypothetical protein